jgi:hypothetical protein
LYRPTVEARRRVLYSQNKTEDIDDLNALKAVETCEIGVLIAMRIIGKHGIDFLVMSTNIDGCIILCVLQRCLPGNYSPSQAITDFQWSRYLPKQNDYKST